MNRSDEISPPARGHDSLVTPESSMFGTRTPRPEGAGRHLLVVLAVSLMALGLAVLFAERDVEESPATFPNQGLQK